MIPPEYLSTHPGSIYFTITADVTNPHPDRRRTTYLAAIPVIPAGATLRLGPLREDGGRRLTLVRVPNEHRISMPTDSLLLLGPTPEGRKPAVTTDDTLARRILDAPSSGPLPRTLGMVLHDAKKGENVDAGEILALLLDHGAITLDQVALAAEAIPNLDKDVPGNRTPAWDLLRTRHDLDL